MDETYPGVPPENLPPARYVVADLWTALGHDPTTMPADEPIVDLWARLLTEVRSFTGGWPRRYHPIEIHWPDSPLWPTPMDVEYVAIERTTMHAAMQVEIEPRPPAPDLGWKPGRYPCTCGQPNQCRRGIYGGTPTVIEHKEAPPASGVVHDEPEGPTP